jgi:hypothetical protein
MIKGLMLASIGVAENGAFSEVFAQWEQVGIFSHVLPFLLIFALVFGILTKVKLFKENKAINAIIALVVGLMAIQFSFVSMFFENIFPRVGIALMGILALFIVIGLFTDETNPVVNWILLGISVIVFVIVLVQTGGALGVATGNWWEENWPTVIISAVAIILVIAVVAGTAKRPKDPSFTPIWAKPADK